MPACGKASLGYLLSVLLSFWNRTIAAHTLLIVSDCTEDMLQNPLKPTERFTESPNSKLLWFSPSRIVQCLSPVCQDRSRILAFRNI